VIKENMTMARRFTKIKPRSTTISESTVVSIMSCRSFCIES